MLGAVSDFLTASTRGRLPHGRAAASEFVARDHEGPRSCHGVSKLGALRDFGAKRCVGQGNDDLCRDAGGEQT
eukprot:11186069-Lingulodinium_polyedra.AAC.1